MKFMHKVVEPIGRFVADWFDCNKLGLHGNRVLKVFPSNRTSLV